MQTLVVVKVEIGFEVLVRVGSAGIVLEVDFLVFDASPQSFHHDVVDGSTHSIHADLNIGFLEQGCEVRARKLASLIAVENSGRPFLQRVFERMNAKRNIQGVGQFP